MEVVGASASIEATYRNADEILAAPTATFRAQRGPSVSHGPDRH